MQSYSSLVAQSISERVLDNTKNSNVLMSRYSGTSRPTYYSEPWKAISYTPMTGWYVLNYTMLGLFLSLPIAGIYELAKLFL